MSESHVDLTECCNHLIKGHKVNGKSRDLKGKKDKPFKKKRNICKSQFLFYLISDQLMFGSDPFFNYFCCSIDSHSFLFL